MPGGHHETFFKAAITVVLLGCAGLGAPSSASADVPLPDASDLVAGESVGLRLQSLIERTGALAYGFDRGENRFVVRTPLGDSASAVLRTAVEALAIDVSFESSRFSVSSLNSANATMRSAAATLAGQQRNRYFGFEYDPWSDTVAVTTNAAKEDLFPLLGSFGTAFSYHYAADGGRRATRGDDGEPYHGAARIFPNGCSTGFTVRLSNGDRAMMTAAHCFGNGTQVTDGGGDRVGVSGARTGYPSFDMQRIKGETYSRDIYTGGAAGVRLAVKSAGPTSLTGSYCQSGATSYEHCGEDPTSLEATFCDEDGCTDDLISYRGYAPRGGDSGGTFYGKNGDPAVLIRGMIIAGGGNIGYAESWDSIRSHLNATIVTDSL